jgi:hypothetical protein
MREYLRVAFLGIVGGLLVGLFLGAVQPRKAHAADYGQWDRSNPIVQWYQTLMQPDAPTASCCGEADAYWCDDVHVRDSKTFCKITDDRLDEPLKRPHRDVGEEVEIPNQKLKFDAGNPTGHYIVFLSRGGYVYCFVQGTQG